MTIEGTAQVGLPNQRGGWTTPMALNTQFTAPTSGLSSDTHKMATATPLRTAGMNRIVRKTFIPFIFKFSRRDKPKPAAIYSGIAITVYLRVTRIDCKNWLSLKNISLKLAVPIHLGVEMMYHSVPLMTMEARIGPTQKMSKPINQGERKA